MADTEIPRPEEQTPQSPFQNVRTNGRAFNSPNWRMKSESSPQASPSPRTNTSRTAFARPGPHVPQAISEGRRLYVGNMPYTAKSEDVEALFTAAEYLIERIDIAIDPFTGRNPSYCFVDLQTKEHAQQAMTELDGRDMLGRPVKIKPGVAKSAERAAEQPRSPVAMGRWRPQEGTSGAKVNSDSSQRVYVGGLPRLTEAESVESNMRTFFQGYSVENVSKVFTPHPAKRFEPGDHYYLFVDFSSVDEAQRAMDTLNGHQGPWGGPLRVQRARGTTNKPEGSSTPGAEGDEQV
ncbi:uncharacterized protein N7482_004787 [Penicillium canariense]|uniref:RRM domain-containing protein n=1 Tax=Penicillium canariense TaxID=189055 RepID=A0A9W9LQU1_9EURO|nr:uncharacterized protein N7482_004787 [Penicillium canariense]KAJ5169193.1 hypothetical protein N7482_004787 [Penicillium canariense]